jgi:integrase
MSPTKRNGVFYLYVPLQSGGVRLRTTGTKDAGVYRGMKRMVAQLKDARRWALLTAVHSGRLTLGALYDAHAANALDALEASLSASKLAAHANAYLAHLQSLGRVERYVGGVERSLQHFIAATASGTTADLTTAAVTAWISGLDASPGTRRQYLYAVTGFARYLVRVGVLASYPLGAVEAPDKNPARKRWETEANDRRIVEAASPKYRALFAFIKATGCDVSTAFRTRRRDVDLDRARVRLQGTKTAQRDVDEAIIEAWALPYLSEHCATHTANALLWPEGAGKPGKHGRHETPFYSVAGAGKHHDKCCAALELEDYTLKDARHSVAVRMRFAGYDYEQIAGQLGNSAYQVAKVYARFTPTLDRKTGAQG